ncbi:MAG: 30S ribosomal protein S16 [Candidatus Neomarinimicrobiota bacterium]|nr:30S ribosomal protein S16 [Candidatus Neomarinimicrobiota bacterium]
MAVRIRMKRLGRRKRPFYRLVAIDSKSRREGAEVERLGWYDPLNKDNHFDLKEERIRHWLGIGAKASSAARGLFKKSGLAYKWHLEKNGKNEEEIIDLLNEWRERKKVQKIKNNQIPVDTDLSDVTEDEKSKKEPKKVEEKSVVKDEKSTKEPKKVEEKSVVKDEKSTKEPKKVEEKSVVKDEKSTKEPKKVEKKSSEEESSK